MVITDVVPDPGAVVPWIVLEPTRVDVGRAQMVSASLLTVIGSGALLVRDTGPVVTGPVVAAAHAAVDDAAGSAGAHHRLNREKTAHLPAYFDRNMLAPRHWNPPGS